MISLTLARKYARAFLEIGLQEGNYEDLGKDLEKMAEVLKENKELRTVLASAAYPVATRKAIAKTIGESLGLSKSTVDFINILIERDRMDHFREITKSYESLCDVVAKRIRATLVTAMSLSPEWVKCNQRSAGIQDRKRSHSFHGTRPFLDWRSPNQDRQCGL